MDAELMACILERTALRRDMAYLAGLHDGESALLAWDIVDAARAYLGASLAAMRNRADTEILGGELDGCLVYNKTVLFMALRNALRQLDIATHEQAQEAPKEEMSDVER